MQPQAEELAAFLELVGMASLCSWTVCLAVGLGLCPPDRALLMGVPGTLFGGLLFRFFGWPVGPVLDGYPILPALVGTTFVLAVTAYVARFRHARAEPSSQVRAFKDWPEPPRQPPT